MNRLVKELTQCLINEKKLYENYYLLVCRKIEITQKNDIDLFSQIINEEKVLLSKILLLEEKRSKLISMISDKSDVTISDISAMINNSFLKKEINVVIKEFSELINKIKEKNETCNNMIQLNINYINFMLSSVMTEDNTYSYNGKDENKKQKLNIFDKKV